jgi:hypothetical protein
MGNESLKALQKRNKSVGTLFHLSDHKNVADLVDDSDLETEKPPVRKTPTKSLFGSLLGEARRGGQDTVTPEKMKENQERKAIYEQAMARPAISQPKLPTGLPSLNELARVTQALQDGTAFHGDSYRPDYRPNNDRPASTYRPESPRLSHSTPRPTNSNQLGGIFSVKKSSNHKNFSSVSFCDHQEFTIDWHPKDPMNDQGSWQAKMVKFDDRSPWEQHVHCKEADVRAKVQQLAEKIIGKYEDMENGNLSKRAQSQGERPGRSPPKARVEREVQNMYPRLHRKIIEKKEALRVKLDAADCRKEEAEKLQKRAQEDVQRGEKAKGLDIDDLEDDDEPIITKKTKRSAKQIAEQKVARNRQRKEARGTTELLDRFRPSTADERQTKLGKQVRNNRAATQSNTGAKQGKSPATKPTQAPPKPRNGKRPVKSDDESDGSPVKKITKTHKKQDAASKPKPREMTAEERALLEGITQAEQGEHAQSEAEPETDAQAEDEEAAATERAKLFGKPAKPSKPEPSKKRKATDDAELSPKKKGKKEHKSAAIIEDSDEEADYELPEVPSDRHEAPVRQGWAAEAEELVEEVHYKQEALEKEKEAAVEKGEVVVVDERITTTEVEVVKAVQVEPTVEDEPTQAEQKPSSPFSEKVLRSGAPSPQAASSSQEEKSTPPTSQEKSTTPMSPASAPSKKRKLSVDETDGERSSLVSSSSRLIKMAKKAAFSKKVVSPVEREWKMSIPYILDTQDDEGTGSAEEGND